MRFYFAILSVASLVSAAVVPEGRTNFPTCASTCSTQFDPSPCSGGDVTCLCLNQNYRNQVLDCFREACSEQEYELAVSATFETCKAASVDFSNNFPACAAGTCTRITIPPGCRSTDNWVSCACGYTNTMQHLFSCFRSSCTGQDLEKAELFMDGWCRAVGIDITPAIGGAKFLHKHASEADGGVGSHLVANPAESGDSELRYNRFN